MARNITEDFGLRGLNPCQALENVTAEAHRLWFLHAQVRTCCQKPLLLGEVQDSYLDCQFGVLPCTKAGMLVMGDVPELSYLIISSYPPFPAFPRVLRIDRRPSR